MGCWDVFCFLCGNTCHGTLNDIKENFLESVEYYESKNKKVHGLKNILNQFMKFIKKIRDYF